MTSNYDNMGDTFNFNGSIGQFVKEGDGIIHDYHAQSVASSSSMQEEKTTTETAQADASDTTQLSNRQVVILMTGLLNISLSPDFTNQKQLAQFLSRLTGRSMESIRQTIMSLAKSGIETPQARRDSLIAADALEPVCGRVARILRNDARD